MNISSCITANSRLTPDAIAVRSAESSLSYAELERRIEKAADYLIAQGIRKGDIVAISLASETSILIACFANARIGAAVFCLPKHYPALQKREMSAATGASWLLADSIESEDPSLTERVPFLMNEVLSSTARPKLLDEDFSTSLALIVLGSGSTGKAKLMPFSHELLIKRVERNNNSLPLTDQDCLASEIHLNFYSSFVRALCILTVGGTFAIVDKKKPPIPENLKTLGVTFLQTTVLHIHNRCKLLPAQGRNHYDFLKGLSVHSSAVSNELRRQIVTQMTKDVYIVYGTNECGTISVATPDELFDPPNTVGTLIEDVELEIVDDNNAVLPQGNKGIARIKTSACIDGYLNDPKGTASVFRDGWFFPGDVLQVTESSKIVHFGRADLVMIMNGINIYPGEIESTVSSHPNVQDCVALPISHPIHGDIPVCAVTLVNSKEFNGEELFNYVSQRLGARSPRKIIQFDSLPRNDRGKIDRNSLREKIINYSSSTETNNPTMITDLKRKQSIVIDIESPQEFELVELDKWVDAVFQTSSIPAADLVPDLSVGDQVKEEGIGTENGEEDGERKGEGNERDSNFLWLVERFSLLFLKILEAAGVPVFVVPQAEQLKFSAEENKLTATISITKIDYLAPRVYQLAANATLSSLYSFRRRSLTEESLTTYFSFLNTKALSSIREYVPPGKSTIHVLKTAYSLNIPFQHLGSGLYQLGWGSQGTRIDRSTCELDSAMGAKLAKSKLCTARLLRSCGLPVPEHRVTQEIEEAKSIASELGWPVVVKPLDGERGEGVSVGVDNVDSLEKAFKNAKLKEDSNVLVEKEAEGVCHRIFIANGKLLYAVKRWPKSVQGDGSSTIRELVDAANKKELLSPPWEKTEPYPADEITEKVLKENGYTFDSIPEQGAWIRLRVIESTQDGGLDEEVTDSICDENIRIAVAASQIMGLSIAGVDIISSDITRPWYSNSAIINEVNFAPLLGGGEISRRHIPEYLHRIVDGNGRIPVLAFTGDDNAFQTARTHQQECVAKGARCILTSHDKTINDEGMEITLPFNTLYERCNALLLNKNVDSIVLVVQNDDILTTGLPIDCLNEHIVLNKNLVINVKMNQQKGKRTERILSLLRRLVKE